MTFVVTVLVAFVVTIMLPAWLIMLLLGALGYGVGYVPTVLVVWLLRIVVGLVKS